ncbi:MAG: hypothetical protein A2X82_07620 [Geobacteraceae bacterium GWC2_55_20]|nr:MAG: hypothetical protein A2X82_07620 [Geobacteraceae bacterium GWC2_55_20]OGU18713.1 MAG: hypothetical protein A2X85_01330 [Geobacteraceae bacterium GWF2_54_21]HBA73189.1 hypothetical protein [Geobacter sp.]HCE67573.1 hypothetical protein [Geobacter sp.]
MDDHMRNQKNNFIQRFSRNLFFAAALLLVPAIMSTAANNTKTVARYKVSSMGFDIGDVTTSQRFTEDGGLSGLQFETRTMVKASFLWMGYHQDTVEKGTLRKRDLVSYSRKGRENGAVIDIEGRLEGPFFRFEVREHGGTRSVVIPRDSYDYTTMECPEARLDFKDKAKVTLRVLDVEKLAVVKREYRLIRNSQYMVDRKDYPCRIVDFTDQNKKARRWIAWDGATVVMYRQDGRGEKNSYSVRATSVAREL